MSPAQHDVDGGGKGFARGLAVDLARVLREAEDGDLIALSTSHPALDAALSTWSTFLGHTVLEKTPLEGGGLRYLIRVGGVSGYSDDEEDPAHRIWIYTNRHCNLACDYCCVRSSPRAEPEVLPVATVQRIAQEGKRLGFRRIFLTGGEPFLRPDLDEVVRACTNELPTTLLSNGMLWSGPRGRMLEAMPRDRLTLQVSLDSPDPELHDAHRGAGSWAKAREGIARARSLGFRVRVAATTHTTAQAEVMRTFLEAEGIPARDRVIRPVALRGFANEGVRLQRSELRPEVTFTTRGVYWHPVGATDDDFRVLNEVGTLQTAVAAVHDLERADRAASGRNAAVFQCA